MIGYSLVNQKGQVTIPSSIRKALKISPAQHVTVAKEGDSITIKKVEDIFSLKGSVKPRKLPSKAAMRKAFFDDLTKKK